MNQLKVRNIVIGEGKPAVCVPVVGRTEEEIEKGFREAVSSGADLVEWRADWFDGCLDEERLTRVLACLRAGLADMPLLVTFRTMDEGGEKDITLEDYDIFIERVIDSGTADLVDVELFRGEERLGRLCGAAHEKGVCVVASSHDFKATPPVGEMIGRLCRMQELGADLLKIAVMPRDASDVLKLLEATYTMKRDHAKRPLITMAMGKTGVISRLCGEVFGSSLTFGSAGTASAPGQVEVQKLREALDIIHGNPG